MGRIMNKYSEEQLALNGVTEITDNNEAKIHYELTNDSTEYLKGIARKQNQDLVFIDCKVENNYHYLNYNWLVTINNIYGYNEFVSDIKSLVNEAMSCEDRFIYIGIKHPYVYGKNKSLLDRATMTFVKPKQTENLNVGTFYGPSQVLLYYAKFDLLMSTHYQSILNALKNNTPVADLDTALYDAIEEIIKRKYGSCNMPNVFAKEPSLSYNGTKKTFSLITCECPIISRYATVDSMKQNYSDIINYLVAKINKDKKFISAGVPINYFKVGKAVLRKNNVFEVTFQLKIQTEADLEPRSKK